MISKEKLISEIQRLAEINGNPPGQKLFEKETGFSKTYWNGTYWPRWSAALRDAGLTPNSKNAAIPLNELMDNYLLLVSEIGTIPTISELRFKARNTIGFPAASTFARQLGTQAELIAKVYEYAKKCDISDDVMGILEESQRSVPPTEYSAGELAFGSVYLLQSGDHYKIGRSSDIERRVKEISVAMPQKVELVHSIQTDDTAGIENYWHRRFASKRLNGEWFELTLADVRAFRRRKFQ